QTDRRIGGEPSHEPLPSHGLDRAHPVCPRDPVNGVDALKQGRGGPAGRRIGMRLEVRDPALDLLEGLALLPPDALSPAWAGAPRGERGSCSTASSWVARRLTSSHTPSS